MILIKPSNTSEELAECIGKKSTLYIQLGCHACEAQEKLFGDNYKHLNVIDCFLEKEKCSGITATPTWKIGEELFKGIQSIENLKKLTRC